MKRALLASLLLGLGAVACGADETSSSSDEDLTSLTGAPRTLVFDGYVDVAPSTSDAQILSAVRRQTQSAFGALRTANIGVADRELKDVDASTFRKETLSVVDGQGKVTGSIERVAYRYTTTAVVPKAQANQSSAPLAVLVGNYQAAADRVLQECTENSQHDRDFRDSLWYVFNPSLRGCQSAMGKEQAAIEAARAKLADKQVASIEADRLYLPVTMQLQPSAETSKTTFPEYDKLFSGGVKPDHLVIGYVAGFAADWAAGEKVEPIDDRRFPIWLETLSRVFSARPGWKLTSADGAISHEEFQELVADHEGQRRLDRARKVALGEKVVQKWITFQVPVQVSVGGAPSKPFTIELQTYFGAGSEKAPYKRAVKTSDVFLYAGHSYIGYGPLDPSNFTASDFPSTYQLFFVNGCVSFNYYDRGYWKVKEGGSKTLDTITNAIETPQYGSGEGAGRFLAELVSGKNGSYADLLTAAQFDYQVGSWGRDGLRVVDGEQDNTFDPAKTRVTVK